MPKINVFQQLLNPRLMAILLLGFASGLPLALTGSTLQAWFTQSGVNVVTIGALSLVGLPYTLKFLWAPVMDYYRFPRVGTRKLWILLTQAGLIVSIALLGQLNPITQATLMGGVCVLIAFLSASQDVSITAYQTDVLLENERGFGVAYYVFTYRIATLISGGLALIVADYIGWQTTYSIMAGVMAVVMLLTLWLPRAKEEVAQDANVLLTMRSAIVNLLSRKDVILLWAFIVFYKLGDALALQLMTNFLLRGLGFTLTEVGLAYKLVSMVALILGAFVGGVALSRWRLFDALMVFGLAQAFSTLLFVALAWIGKNYAFMATAVFIENFCTGLSTAALFTLMLSLCDHRYSASQFAILSTFASLGRVLLGPLAGALVAYLGWAQFFLVSFLLCFPGIYLLFLLKNSVTEYANATAS